MSFEIDLGCKHQRDEPRRSSAGRLFAMSILEDPYWPYNLIDHGGRTRLKGREPSGARCPPSGDIGQLKVQQAYGRVWMGSNDLF